VGDSGSGAMRPRFISAALGETNENLREGGETGDSDVWLMGATNGPLNGVVVMSGMFPS